MQVSYLTPGNLSRSRDSHHVSKRAASGRQENGKNTTNQAIRIRRAIGFDLNGTAD